MNKTNKHNPKLIAVNNRMVVTSGEGRRGGRRRTGVGYQVAEAHLISGSVSAW